MVVHYGGLYTGCQLVTEVTPIIVYSYIIFTLQQMSVHSHIYLQ